MARTTFVLFALSALLFACGDTDTGGFSEEVIDGAPSGKADSSRAIEFREFDYYVPPASALAEPTHRLITTPRAFERVFGEAPRYIDFDREWLVLVAAGKQSESGVLVRIDGVQLSASQKSLQVLTTRTTAGAACDTTATETRPFKLVSFRRPSVAPQAVRYYASDDEMSCSQSACQADALSLLTATSEGVNVISEGDYPFEPIMLAGAAAEAVAPEATARLLGEPNGALIDSRDFDDWFQWRAEVDDPDDAPHVREAEAFQSIRSLYQSRFTNLRVLRVGEVEVHVYLIGETSCGDLAVLRTVSTET